VDVKIQGLQGELSNLRMSCDEFSVVPVLKGVECLNVDVPSNKIKVRGFYQSQIRERMIKDVPVEEEDQQKVGQNLDNNQNQNGVSKQT